MERLCLVLFCIGVLVTCQTNVKTRNYNINFNKRMNSGIFGKHQRILSYHECAIYCQSVVNCWTANFHSIDNVCELSRDSPRTQPRNQVENPGWIVLHRNDECDDHWVAGRNSCYISVDISLSWHDAEDYCQIYDSNLVEINNAEENAFMKDWLNDGQTNVPDKYYWTGGRGNGDNFVWSSNGEPLNFTKWYFGDDPQCGQGFNYSGYCIEVAQFYDFSWRYISCNNSVPFICERQKN